MDEQLEEEFKEFEGEFDREKIKIIKFNFLHLFHDLQVIN
jgi:hypothetical protein